MSQKHKQKLYRRMQMDKIEMHEVADILNTINLELWEKGFEAAGYDNTGEMLMVLIQRTQTIAEKKEE